MHYSVGSALPGAPFGRDLRRERRRDEGIAPYGMVCSCVGRAVPGTPKGIVYVKTFRAIDNRPYGEVYSAVFQLLKTE